MRKLFIITVILFVIVPFVTAQSSNELTEWETGENIYSEFGFPQCHGTQQVGFFDVGAGVERWTIWTRERRDSDGNLAHFHHHREGTATFDSYGYTFVWDIVQNIHWKKGEQVKSVYNSNNTRQYFDANGVYATWERGRHNDDHYSNFVCLRTNV